MPHVRRNVKQKAVFFSIFREKNMEGPEKQPHCTEMNEE